jgi:hypothetical protein
MDNTIKTAATYIIAGIVIVGGGILLVVPSQIPSNELLPFLTGIVGTVIGFVFSERSATSAINNQPTVTTTAGPPPTTTITPATGEAPTLNTRSTDLTGPA